MLAKQQTGAIVSPANNRGDYCFALPLRLRAFRLARPEKKSLFKLWSSRIDYSSMRREASITLRIPIAKNATRIPGGVLQKSELRQRPFRRRMGRDVVVDPISMTAKT